MKVLIKFLFVALCASLLFSCAKEEALLESEGEMTLKKASKAFVIEVVPNGVDDTENLKNAFADAMAEGAGSVVQLCEGEYHLGFIQVYDFEGCLKGAGKGKTIITALNDLDAQALKDQNLSPDLVKFIGGDVHLRDFTIRTPEGKLTVSGTPGHIRCLINFSATNAIYEWDNPNRSINAVVDNVCVKGNYWEGGVGYFNAYNSYFGLRAGWDYHGGWDMPRERINLKLTNSQVDNFVYGLVLEGFKESEMLIGEKNNGNLICNNDQGGGVWEFRDSEISLIGNTFMIPNNAWGIDLDNRPWYGSMLRDEPQNKSSVFQIENNVFNMDHSRYSMFYFDFRREIDAEEPPVLFTTKNNRFNFEGGTSNGVLCIRTKDAVFRNNKFSGEGKFGIRVGSWHATVFNENGLILGNNFSNGSFVASVYLNHQSRNWTVVGGNLGETMVNEGENNLISGFNNMDSDVPLGQTISDNLKDMKGPMHNLK